MWKWLIKQRLAAFERQYDYDMSYARDILAADARALFAFAKLGAMGSYRRDLPRDAYFAAKLTGTMVEDCGPCTQLMVTMALREGVSAKTIAAVLRGDDEILSEEVHLAVALTRAALAREPSADAFREEIERRWGPRAVVSLAFAMTMARVYPTLKYALGHGQACRRVIVEGAPIAVMRGAA